MVNENSTLKEAKDWLRERLGEGAQCPCCTQFAKKYPRTIHSTMARQLIAFYHASQEAGLSSVNGQFPFVEWAKVMPQEFHAQRGTDFVKLAYWGLIEEQPNTDPDRRSSGFWRLLPKGVDFVTGKLGVKKRAIIYSNRVLAFEGDVVYIRDCLGDKFSYSELMTPPTGQAELFTGGS